MFDELGALTRLPLSHGSQFTERNMSRENSNAKGVSAHRRGERAKLNFSSDQDVCLMALTFNVVLATYCAGDSLRRRFEF